MQSCSQASLFRLPAWPQSCMSFFKHQVVLTGIAEGAAQGILSSCVRQLMVCE